MVGEHGRGFICLCRLRWAETAARYRETSRSTPGFLAHSAQMHLWPVTVGAFVIPLSGPRNSFETIFFLDETTFRFQL